MYFSNEILNINIFQCEPLINCNQNDGFMERFIKVIPEYIFRLDFIYRNASNKRPGANLIFGALGRALIRGGGGAYTRGALI